MSDKRMSENHELVIKMTPHQLAYTIEAYHDFIIERLRWVLSDKFKSWRSDIEFEVPQGVVGDVVNMYGFCLQSYRAHGEPSEEFVSLVSFTEKEWDLLNKLHAATSWADVPTVPDNVFE